MPERLFAPQCLPVSPSIVDLLVRVWFGDGKRFCFDYVSAFRSPLKCENAMRVLDCVWFVVLADLSQIVIKCKRVVWSPWLRLVD